MQIIAEKKFANMLDRVCLVPYTYDISQTKGKKMATKITLTDNEVKALLKWCEIGADSEAETESPRQGHLEQIIIKLQKEGWE
jgi:hypothetical protein